MDDPAPVRRGRERRQAMRAGILRAAVLLALLCAPCRGAELLRVIREPTAGVLARRTYNVSLSTYPSEGLAFSLTAGVLDRFMIGLSFGGRNITGYSDAEFWDHVYARLRFRVIDETEVVPGIALGFDNQPEPSRSGAAYLRPERDLYVALSKNFSTIGGDMALHAGISADLQDPVHAGLWTGVDKSLPGGFGLALEYDFATDGAREVRFDEEGGFLSAEVFWQSFGQVRVSLQFIDLLETGGESYRALGIDFLGMI